jgi:hypothetical protein
MEKYFRSSKAALPIQQADGSVQWMKWAVGEKSRLHSYKADGPDMIQ